MSTNKFKVGDIVEYKYNLYSSVTFNIGAKFKVTRLASNGNLYLESIDNSSAPFGSYTTDQFELVESKPKFKVGDKVRCVRDRPNLEIGRVYTVVSVSSDNYWYRVVNDLDVIDGYTADNFELVTKDAVLTPEEVFKHLREGTKLQWCCKSTLNWIDHSGELNHIELNELIDYGWRVKPEPEIITLNGKRYQALED